MAEAKSVGILISLLPFINREYSIG